MRNLKVKSKNIHLLFLPRDLLFFMFFVIYKNINVSKRCRKAFVFFAPIAVLCVLSDTENISQETQSFRKERKVDSRQFFVAFVVRSDLCDPKNYCMKREAGRYLNPLRP